MNALLSVQKRAARIISDIKDIQAPENRSHILFSQLGWMPIYHRLDFRIATMVYKILNNLPPPYMAKLFKLTADFHNRQTRVATRNVININEVRLIELKHKYIEESKSYSE